HDVELRPEGVTAVRLVSPEVRVGFDTFGRARVVELHAGEAIAEGSPEEIEQALRGWRERHPPSASPEKRARVVALRGDGLAVHWRGGERGEAEITGMSIARDDGGFELTLEHARARSHSVVVE